MTVKLSNTPVGVTPKRTDIEFEGVKVAEINADGIKGDGVSYDNTTSGLAATDLQGAIDETAIPEGVTINLTSGTEYIFTGIPANAKRVILNYINISLSGTSVVCVQAAGNGAGFTSSGYRGTAVRLEPAAAIQVANLSSNFFLTIGGVSDSDAFSGRAVFEKIDDDFWAWESKTGIPTNSNYRVHECYGALGGPFVGPLDRIRLFSLNGTDTFDGGGIINLRWEV